MEQTIIDFIKNDILNGQPDVELDAQEDLLGSGLIASMSMMRIIQFIEQEFDIKVAPQDMTIEHFMTVETMANYVKQSKAVAE